jgi:hypothetical protein
MVHKGDLMKRLLILLLLLPALAWGGEPIEIARMNPYILGAGTGAAACTPAYSATEKLTGAICTDDTGGSEADNYFDSVGWVVNGSPTIDSSTGDTHAGTYKLEVTASGSYEGAYRAPSLTAGTLYKLSMWARHTGTAANNGEYRCYLSAIGSSLNTYITPMLVDTNTTYTQYVKLFYQNARLDTIVCEERNSDNDGGLYIDDVSIKEVTTQCLGDEKLTDANAAITDANATTGFTMVSSGAGAITSESATPDPPAGQSYYIQQTTAADGDRFYMDLSGILTIGTEYFISWKQIAISGDAFACGLSGANTTSFSIDASEYIGAAAADTSWLQEGFSFTYDTASHRYFKCVEAGGTENAVFAIDQLSIKEILSK